MAKKDVVDETKRVLEMMGESEEKVLLLHEELSQNRILFQKIKDDLKKLRELKNTNTAKLEDNQHLKDNMKMLNKCFLNYAQQIYSCDQELYSDLSSHEAELVKTEDLLQSNKERLKEKESKNKYKETILLQELELVEKEEEEVNRKNELESKELMREIEELKAEEKTVKEQKQYYENYMKSKVLDDEQEFRNIIASLQECIASKEQEIDESTKSLEDVKQSREKLEKEVETSFLEWDYKIKESQSEIKESTLIINENQQKIDEICGKVKLLEENNESNKQKYDNFEQELNNIEVNLNILAENHNKTIDNNKKTILENLEMYKQQQALMQQNILDLEATKKKIETQQDYIQAITKFITEQEKTDSDLKIELQEHEETKENVKKHFQSLKEEYNRRKSELEEKLKQGQEEIESTEQINRKLQADIEAFASDLTLFNWQLEQTETEEKERVRAIEELDDHIKHLNIKLKEFKTKKKPTDLNVMVAQPSRIPEEKRQKIRHWDSDSSIEGEDRTMSNLVKQKMKYKKGSVRK